MSETGTNGANGANGQQQLQVNPIEVAQHALMFLGRADFKRHERQAFDLVEAMLQAIAAGKVKLAAAPEAQQPLPLEAQASPMTQ
jgi:hypothetical protein